MKATEDFSRVVLYSYIAVAAKTCTPDGIEINCKAIADLVVKKHVKISLPDSIEATTDDSVYNYTLHLMCIAMLWLEFHDAIWEGDGDRIIKYWKFLIFVFSKTNHYILFSPYVQFALSNSKDVCSTCCCRPSVLDTVKQ